MSAILANIVILLRKHALRHTYQSLRTLMKWGKILEKTKNAIFIVLKTLIVLFIPYNYFVYFDQIGALRHTSITGAITGTWGLWSPGHDLFSFGYEPGPLWEQNQILFSLLFILPLIAFSYFYGQRTLDKNCIIAAGVSISLSSSIVYLLTPSLGILGSYYTPDLVVPSAVSLAVFVFVFWPLLRSSWPSFHDTKVVEQKKGIASKLIRILKENVPINVATLVWMSIIIFPAIVTISSIWITETTATYYLSISGGLSTASYSYDWIHFGYNTTVHTSFLFTMAGWISPFVVLIGALNLVLGVTTLRFINGKSSIKRVRTLATILILFYVIPSIIALIPTLLMGLGMIAIPLPIYPIMMLLIAKYVYPPSQGGPMTEEMIRIPLRTRVSSIFHRIKQSEEDSDSEELEDKNEDLSSP